MCHTTVCDVAPVVPCPGYMSAVPLSAPCGHVAAMIGAAVVVSRALVPALGRRRARPVFRCGLTVTTPALVLRSAVASGLSPVLLPRRVCAAGRVSVVSSTRRDWLMEYYVFKDELNISMKVRRGHFTVGSSAAALETTLGAMM